MIPYNLRYIYFEISNCSLPLLILATLHATCHNLSAQIAGPSSPPFGSSPFFFIFVLLFSAREGDNLHANDQRIITIFFFEKGRKLHCCWGERRWRCIGRASKNRYQYSFLSCFRLPAESSYLRSSILTKRLNYPYDCERTPSAVCPLLSFPPRIKRRRTKGAIAPNSHFGLANKFLHFGNL